MNQTVDWAKLVIQGRAKAYGIPWSEGEAKARAAGIPAEYVRNGILTKEDYQKALEEATETAKPKEDKPKASGKTGAKKGKASKRAAKTDKAEDTSEDLKTANDPTSEPDEDDGGIPEDLESEDAKSSEGESSDGESLA